MSKHRRCNYFFSDYGFIANGKVVLYELNYKAIAVEDILEVEIIERKHFFHKNSYVAFAFFLSDISIGFYLGLLSLIFFYMLYNINKKVWIMNFILNDNATFSIKIDKKSLRKAFLFKKRIFEYKATYANAIN